MRMRVAQMLPLALLLSGCMEHAATRIGSLVLLPFLLVMVILWLLNRGRSGEEPWEEEHFPDSDDDENEDHHLM